VSARGGWLATSALLLAACNGSAPAPAAPAVPAVAAPAAPAAPAAVHVHVLRGHAVLGKDGYGIVPCGESEQKILEITPGAKPFLDKFLAGGAHEFFVEAEGAHLDNGHLSVLRFFRLYSEGAGCDAPLQGMAFAAWGNEPFWAAVNAGDALRLERPGEAPVIATPVAARQESADWIVEGASPAGPLSLRLAPGFCSDGMSDALYAWTATARLGEQDFHGCGFRGSSGDEH
jgi:uncharacterized membrane protein